MSDIASVQQRLHTLLEQIFEPPVETVEGEDYYVFTRGSAAILVFGTQDEDGLPFVKVASPIVTDTQKSPQLLDLLNDMNSAMEFARAYWSNGYVWVAASLIGETCDREELESALKVVGEWADGVDEAFAQAFGGVMPNAPKGPPVGAWLPPSGAAAFTRKR
jgi:hypothetical protein